MYASNEKIAHDLAVAIVAQKCINSNPTEIELEYLENQDIIHP